MDLTEIKKLLYKEKPIAKRLFAAHETYQYFADLSIGKIYFSIPVKEMGDLPFGETEQAQLLIRWIKQ